jgi:hypothetical protein
MGVKLCKSSCGMIRSELFPMTQFGREKKRLWQNYMTVWKGKEKAMAELYGSWEASFGMLFNWKANVMRLMTNSVVEIDVEFKDDMPYFQRFFCALGPCIDDFLNGCRPYLSIDSTTLNGRPYLREGLAVRPPGAVAPGKP